jgi:hypothetical protein
VIDQLTTVDRDFEGFEATMELEEEETHAVEASKSASDSSSSSTGDVRDTRGAIEGLAAQVAGLNIGRAVDLSHTEKAAKKMREHAKETAKVRAKGRVHLKIGKVTRGKPRA